MFMHVSYSNGSLGWFSGWYWGWFLGHKILLNCYQEPRHNPLCQLAGPTHLKGNRIHLTGNLVLDIYDDFEKKDEPLVEEFSLDENGDRRRFTTDFLVDYLSVHSKSEQIVKNPRWHVKCSFPGIRGKYKVTNMSFSDSAIKYFTEPCTTYLSCSRVRKLNGGSTGFGSEMQLVSFFEGLYSTAEFCPNLGTHNSTCSHSMAHRSLTEAEVGWPPLATFGQLNSCI